MDGIPRLRRAYKTYDEAGKEGVRGAVRSTTEAVLTGARARISIRSGAGRDDLRTRYAPSGLRGTVGHSRRTAYLFHVHYGTRRIAENPFMFNAAEAERGPHQQRLTAAMKSAEGKAAE